MKSEMIYMSIEEFATTDLNSNIASNRLESEYEFNYTVWKSMIFSSQKLRFVVMYAQVLFQWIIEQKSVEGFYVSINTSTVDRFNLSLYKDEVHIFNCTLFTNFYLIKEDEWADKIEETHITKFKIDDEDIKRTDANNFFKAEEGFDYFASTILDIIWRPERYERWVPVQWQIEFKDKKAASSQKREMLANIRQVGIRPEDPYLTIEDALKIEQGYAPEEVAESIKNESLDLESINPIWDEAIALEKKFGNIEEAMRFVNGYGNKKKK